MNIHTMLWNDVNAFSFAPEDFSPLAAHRVICHDSEQAFLALCADADIVLTWNWQANWYQHCPRLKAVYTPAAGADWVQPDPAGKVALEHGTFHGPMLAESLLQALLFMNHGGVSQQRNFHHRGWDRNLAQNSRLLNSQHVMIVGLGHIGKHCQRLIEAIGANVIGIRRHNVDRLEEWLPEMDHVVLLLPGNDDTRGFMDAERLALMKDGAFLYNFGRGNVLPEQDLLDQLPRLGGAYLDVTETEPLPASSPLWQADNLMITPHSSCVYQEYRSLFVAEVAARLEHSA